MHRLLIVDDEESIRKTLSHILGKSGYETVCVESVQLGIQQLQQTEISVVISDIKMPTEDGLTLIHKMRELKMSQPVILITGYPDVDTAKEALKAKAFDYLIKPIQSDQLIEQVKRAVEYFSEQQESEIATERNRQYRQDLEKLVIEKVKRLKESESQFMNLVEQSLTGVFITQGGQLSYANQRFLQMFGYENEELVAKSSFRALISENDRPRIEAYLEKLSASNNASFHDEFSAKTSKGQEIIIEVWAGTVIFEGQQAVQGTVIDITEQKKYQRKEKDLQLKIMNEHKLAAIGQMATGIAHNLNTPISVILGNAELLGLKYNDSPELDKIIRQAERMSGIIQSLLTKSKQEQIQSPQFIDLNVLINTELDFFKADLNFKHNIEKELHFADNIPEIFAVYSDFSQSIMNLLQNAIDAMYQRPAKKLTITTKKDGEYIYISIEDTGCGISDENKVKLLDPFFTTKPSIVEQVADEPTGTGLGLSSVRNLLAPYGVDLHFKSKVDAGTVATLKIPLKNVTAPSKQI